MAQGVMGEVLDDDRFTGEGEAPAIDRVEAAKIRAATRAWREGPLAATEKKLAPRQRSFTTWSGMDVPDLLTPADVPVDYLRDLGLPGEFPFTRGVQPNMYRGRLWTMRQFAGFGSPRQTNERFRYLLQEGQTGLSTAFDFPTLMGYDKIGRASCRERV